MMRVRKNKRRLVSNILLLFAVAVCAAGTFTIYRQVRANNRADAHATRVLQSARSGPTADVPGTTKTTPSVFDAYRVPPDAPRYIFIPTLSVRAIVRPLGLTSSGQLAAPANIFDAGWYVGSAKPGNEGVTVLDGHVSSWTEHGIFYNLKNLKVGDTIRIQRGDDLAITYTVAQSKVYDATAVNMKEILSPIKPGKSGLTLITCDGTVIKGTNEFSKRFVVFAYAS